MSSSEDDDPYSKALEKFAEITGKDDEEAFSGLYAVMLSSPSSSFEPLFGSGCKVRALFERKDAHQKFFFSLLARISRLLSTLSLFSRRPTL